MREPFVTARLWLLIRVVMRDVLLQIIFPRQGFWQKAFQVTTTQCGIFKNLATKELLLIQRQMIFVSPLQSEKKQVNIRIFISERRLLNERWTTHTSTGPSLTNFSLDPVEVFLFPPVPLHLAQSGSRSRLVAHVGVVSGVWRASVWSGARWRPLRAWPGSVTSLRWEQHAGAAFRAVTGQHRVTG